MKMKSFLNSYLDSLTNDLDLANIRLTVYGPGFSPASKISYALLCLHIKYLEFQIKLIEEMNK